MPASGEGAGVPAAERADSVALPDELQLMLEYVVHKEPQKPVPADAAARAVLRGLSRLAVDSYKSLRERSLRDVVRCILNGEWHVYLPPSGRQRKVRVASSFEAFVRAPVPFGLGTTLANLRRLCAPDELAMALLDVVVRAPAPEIPAWFVHASSRSFLHDANERRANLGWAIAEDAFQRAEGARLVRRVIDEQLWLQWHHAAFVGLMPEVSGLGSFEALCSVGLLPGAGWPLERLAYLCEDDELARSMMVRELGRPLPPAEHPVSARGRDEDVAGFEVCQPPEALERVWPTGGCVRDALRQFEAARKAASEAEELRAKWAATVPAVVADVLSNGGWRNVNAGPDVCAQFTDFKRFVRSSYGLGCSVSELLDACADDVAVQASVRAALGDGYVEPAVAGASPEGVSAPVSVASPVSNLRRARLVVGRPAEYRGRQARLF